MMASTRASGAPGGRIMRLGILIPTRGVVMQSARRPPLDECWEMAREADRAGFDAVWVGDSVVAKPRLEAMTTLAYLAAITSRVRLGTAVLLPALRQPVILAQLIANVDQISQGRLVVGVGVGWNLPSAELEWAACGIDHRRRVRHLEEQIALWRALWKGEPLTLDGSGFALADHTIGPLPWRPEGPPILITAGNRGEVYPAQLERFGRLGDGIITTYVSPEQCISLRERAAAALAAHGRARPDFPLCVYTTVPARRRRRGCRTRDRRVPGDLLWREHRRPPARPDGTRAGGRRDPDAQAVRGGRRHRRLHPFQRRGPAAAA